MNRIRGTKGSIARLLLLLATTSVLFSCGGGGSSSPNLPAYTVGGTVSGLAAGETLTLLDNGSDPVTASANGTFTFPTPVTSGGAYSVSVGTSPATAGKFCAIANGSGHAAGNVTGVTVTCGVGTPTVLWSFPHALCSGPPCGTNSQTLSRLTQGRDGNFYAASNGGGVNDAGAVWRITPGGSATVIYSFGPIPVTCLNLAPFCTSSVWPSALFQEGNGNFVGTTSNGGAHGAGSIFEVTPAGALSTLYDFPAVSFCTVNTTCFNSTLPSEPIQARSGAILGTSIYGGPQHTGTVFLLAPSGSEADIAVFSAVGNGVLGPFPGRLVEGIDGNFYGTTLNGGAGTNGSVFQVPAGGGLVQLHAFGPSLGADGSYPNPALVQGPDGTFYGTTLHGGPSGAGTVFRISPAGLESVVYAFGSSGSPADGVGPGNLILGSDGNLYGTTSAGGANGTGVLFRVTPAGVESILLSFGAAGSVSPFAGELIQASDGSLYGVSPTGGAAGAGVFFRYGF